MNQFNSVTRTSSSSNDARYHHSEEEKGHYEIGKDEYMQNSLDRRPYFEDSVSRNVTALVGSTAYLKCRVHNLSNKTVSGDNEEAFTSPFSYFKFLSFFLAARCHLFDIEICIF